MRAFKGPRGGPRAKVRALPTASPDEPASPTRIWRSLARRRGRRRSPYCPDAGPMKGLLIGCFLLIVTVFVRLSWETSAFKNYHPEDSEHSGSRRIEFSSKSTTFLMQQSLYPILFSILSLYFLYIFSIKTAIRKSSENLEDRESGKEKGGGPRY